MNQIKKIELKYIDDVVNLLRDISPYTPPKSTYKDNFLNFISQDKCHGYVIIEKDLVVAYGSIFYENKIRGGKVGHIEDLVVDKSVRNYGLGKKLVEIAVKECQDCYKVILDCSDEYVKFYEKCGFKWKGNQLALYK